MTPAIQSKLLDEQAKVRADDPATAKKRTLGKAAVAGDSAPVTGGIHYVRGRFHILC